MVSGECRWNKRNEQKTLIKCLSFFENTIPCLTYVKNHRLISWRAETNKSMYHLHAYPALEFYKNWAVLLFYHEISFWKQWKSIFPLRWIVIHATWCSLQIFRVGGKCNTSCDSLLWTDTSNTILLAQESGEQDLSRWPRTPLLLGCPGSVGKSRVYFNTPWNSRWTQMARGCNTNLCTFPFGTQSQRTYCDI